MKRRILFTQKKKGVAISPKLTVGLLGFVAIGFLASIIYVTAEASSAGARLASLTQQEARLAQENKALADELVRLGSLIDLEEKASELGYMKPSKIMYVEQTEVAINLP